MTERGIDMIWIVVNDLDKAIKFYTEVIGFQISSITPEYGWAELYGDSGAMLGLAQKNSNMEMQPGENAVITVSVPDVAAEIQQLKHKGAQLVGELIEVPGHVKMQSVRDPDGNLFQLVQTLVS